MGAGRFYYYLSARSVCNRHHYFLCVFVKLNMSVCVCVCVCLCCQNRLCRVNIDRGTLQTISPHTKKPGRTQSYIIKIWRCHYFSRREPTCDTKVICLTSQQPKKLWHSHTIMYGKTNISISASPESPWYTLQVAHTHTHTHAHRPGMTENYWLPLPGLTDHSQFLPLREA